MAATKKRVPAKRIVPIREAGQGRTGTLHMTYDGICELLGPPNCTDLDDPTKVEASWGFAAASDPDQKAFVWCYKRAANACTAWSVDGDPDLLEEVFGGAVAVDRELANRPRATPRCTRHEDCRQSPDLARACLAREAQAAKPKKPKPKPEEVNHHVKILLTPTDLKSLQAIRGVFGLTISDMVRTLIRREHANLKAERAAERAGISRRGT